MFVIKPYPIKLDGLNKYREITIETVMGALFVGIRNDKLIALLDPDAQTETRTFYAVTENEKMDVSIDNVRYLGVIQGKNDMFFIVEDLGSFGI